MVGGFLTRLQQISVAITIIMLLSFAALDRPTVLAAPTGSIRKITQKLRLGTSEEKLQLPAKPAMHAIVVAPTTRLHWHILLGSGGTVMSNVKDEAVRALVGSSPPNCVKKCGACTPCKSVLVPIHTNNLPATPAEYYPEAWRCQCRGKMYNP